MGAGRCCCPTRDSCEGRELLFPEITAESMADCRFEVTIPALIAQDPTEDSEEPANCGCADCSSQFRLSSTLVFQMAIDSDADGCPDTVFYDGSFDYPAQPCDASPMSATFSLSVGRERAEFYHASGFYLSGDCVHPCNSLNFDAFHEGSGWQAYPIDGVVHWNGRAAGTRGCCSAPSVVPIINLVCPESGS